MNIKEIIDFTISEFLNENFKPVEINNEDSEFLLDWKQITINGIIFNFIHPNVHGKNKFIIETDSDGEIGSASLNCYDSNFDGCYLDNIRIDPKYRRIGLATKLYEYIEDLTGKKIKPSPIKQSQEIKKYWEKRNN